MYTNTVQDTTNGLEQIKEQPLVDAVLLHFPAEWYWWSEVFSLDEDKDDDDDDNDADDDNNGNDEFC
eukprot:1070061-Amphidinium_carterae.1